MVRIITDSSVLYTEEAKAAGFDAVPLCVHIGELEGRDLQMDMEDFYKRIEAGQIPRSSQPPVGEVAALYEKYPDSDIINISIADGLSGTCLLYTSHPPFSINRRRRSFILSLSI